MPLNWSRFAENAAATNATKIRSGQLYRNFVNDAAIANELFKKITMIVPGCGSVVKFRRSTYVSELEDHKKKEWRLNMQFILLVVEECPVTHECGWFAEADVSYDKLLEMEQAK